MNQKFYVGAYWSSRKESVEECAGRATAFLEEIAKINELFSSWYLKSWSRAKATASPVSVSRDSLKQLLAAGVNRKDIGGTPLPELGFRFDAWAGTLDGVAATVGMTCGAYSKAVGNVCLLKVTEGHALSADDVQRIVDATVRAWAPDEVEVNSERVYSRGKC